MIPGTGNTGFPSPRPKDLKHWLFYGGNILKSGKNLNQDFKEFLTLLQEEKAEFVLVGGYAVAYHGYPRYTGDMDLLLARDSINVGKILKVIQRFGFGKLSISAEDLKTPDNVVQLGFPPVRIDLLTSLSGVDNEAVFARRIIDDFYGLKIPIISKEDLVRNKKATGRTQDLLDLENLQ
jgi:hypothetical protein